MKDLREEAIVALAIAIGSHVEQTGQLPTMQDVAIWLDQEFDLGTEAQELLISMLRRVASKNV